MLNAISAVRYSIASVERHRLSDEVNPCYATDSCISESTFMPSYPHTQYGEIHTHTCKIQNSLTAGQQGESAYISFFLERDSTAVCTLDNKNRRDSERGWWRRTLRESGKSEASKWGSTFSNLLLSKNNDSSQINNPCRPASKLGPEVHGLHNWSKTAALLDPFHGYFFFF